MIWSAEEIMAAEDRPYQRPVRQTADIIFVRGQGASLFDINGVEYIDCSSGHGVANLGHAHPTGGRGHCRAIDQTDYPV